MQHSATATFMQPCYSRPHQQTSMEPRRPQNWYFLGVVYLIGSSLPLGCTEAVVYRKTPSNWFTFGSWHVN
ncbi:hypothetical protein M438DRAFT_19438 [Aureobasidium pullulans EXF-150]|uniref:Uncharacterized protein n=1 Tax=Aureobasidium pullulans EXF-150 TaxID=1043002 RepID=A0A074XWW7_AURPU|nr:uncharacterized protein M438DRAFT_19438 [Aureobasidium pullulans EXF-150]KEQ90083.1 hypothetical protein M438DRAFT_19438 [Aureobasidium pullulans EXF-150]